MDHGHVHCYTLAICPQSPINDVFSAPNTFPPAIKDIVAWLGVAWMFALTSFTFHPVLDDMTATPDDISMIVHVILSAWSAY